MNGVFGTHRVTQQARNLLMAVDDRVGQFRFWSGIGMPSSPPRSTRSSRPRGQGAAHAGAGAAGQRLRRAVGGTVRRELLDRMLILGQRHLENVLAGYLAHYNQHRPHRALGQASPLGAVAEPDPAANERVARLDRLGGLIHEYAQAA